MNEFLLIFRRDFTNKEVQPSPEEMQQHLKKWQDWLGSIAAQDKLARPLQKWDGEGKVVRANLNVVNGPYVEIKEAIGGMILIKVADYDEAVSIAHGCPVLEYGGNVEIRKAVTPEGN
ncbi:YciI family protein [Flavobacterium hauense]